MEEVTRIRIRRNGWEFELRTRMAWDEVMKRCQRDFSSSTKDIGGPKLKTTTSREGKTSRTA